MSENSIDNDNYKCYTVNEIEARSSNPEDEGYIGPVSTYKDNFDVYFVVDRANYTDDTLHSYCQKILETSEKIWAVSPNVNIVLYAVNGNGYSHFDYYGIFKNAGTLKTTLDTISQNKNVLTTKLSDGTVLREVYLSKAVDSIINKYDGKRKIYGFVFFDSENNIFQTKGDSKALLYGVKYGGKKIDISVCSNIPEKYKSAQNYDEMAYAVALYKMTNGIDISAENFTNQALEHIYGEVPKENQYQYQAIIATGYHPVVLDSPLTEQDRDNAQKLIGKLDENNNVIESTYEFSEAELEDCADTDEDGLWDFEEVMFYLCGNPVIYFDEYGEIELPTVNDILGKGDGKAAKYFNAFSTLAYVESGYDKAQERYADSWDTFVGYPVLPIISDPTSEDGDGDGIFDVNEKWNGIDERYKNILALKSDTIESLYPELRKNDENKPFYISVNKNDIYFNIKINNNDRIEQIRDAISSYWDGKYFGDIYDFYPGMKINVKTRITQTENSNSIEVVFEQSTKRSVTSMNKIIIYSSSLETNEDTKATIAHEFGHIFGLADAYLESGVFNYSCIEFVNSITGSIKTAQRPYGLLPYNFSDESCEIDVFTEIMSICNTKSVVCSNDIEMILNNNAGIHYAKFTPHFYVSKISNAIKTPYLLLYNKDCEMFSYNTKENKITKIDFLDINMTNVDKYLYSYGKKYNTFLATYKDWIDRTYPQYSTETKQIHQKLEMSFNFQSLYSESKSNFRNVSINKDSKTLYLCGMYPNAKEAANDLLDGSGNSIWVLDDESFNDLVDEIIKKSDLDVTYSVSKNDSTILPDNSIWDCAEENVPPHYHILENGFPVNISSKIFVGHEGGFHYEDYYN